MEGAAAAAAVAVFVVLFVVVVEALPGPPAAEAAFFLCVGIFSASTLFVSSLRLHANVNGQVARFGRSPE